MEVQLHIVIAVALCAVILPGLSSGQLNTGSPCILRDGTLGVCRKRLKCSELNDVQKVTSDTGKPCSNIGPQYCCKKNLSRGQHNLLAQRGYLPEVRSKWSSVPVSTNAPIPNSGQRTRRINITMHEYINLHNPQIMQARRGRNTASWVHPADNQGNKNCTTDSREQGVCTNAYECPALRDRLHRSVECSNRRSATLVCCPRPASSSVSVTRTTPGSATSQTTRPTRTGLKSAAKCQEYSKYLIQEVPSPVLLLNAGKITVSLCMARKHTRNQKPLPDAEHAIPKEYPHMAALGYGEESNIEWLCSGSLISENFILTTAHCLSTPTKKPVSWVHLGDLSVQENPYISHDNIRVGKTFPHEHADIALLRLERNVNIVTDIRPVCLYSNQGNPPEYTFATATGWGKYDWGSKPASNDLRKKDLNFETCVNQNPGVSESTHVCVSNPDVDDRSPCVVDSGSPLQIVIDNPNCMNSIVALASSGTNACTDNGNIAVYTRVSTHIQWIEDIVWPD